jgi:transcriptional regulator with XRE-family HTH domain
MDGETLQERLGGAIRKRREALGFSQEAFADQIEMHRTYYGAIERGEKNLTMSTLARICAGLEARMWEVVRDAEE